MTMTMIIIYTLAAKGQKAQSCVNTVVKQFIVTICTQYQKLKHDNINWPKITAGLTLN